VFAALPRAPGLRLDSAPYPLPELLVPYEYSPGRTTGLRRRPSLRRAARFARVWRAPLVDGVVNDPCWSGPATLAGFGARDGGRPVVEPVAVWLAANDSLLCIAARCADPEPGRIKVSITERDGRVHEDDHLNFLLDPHPDDSVYYQVFVNSAGTVADRVCVMRGTKSEKDYAWNATWRAAARRDRHGWSVELSCPLAELGASGSPLAWGWNATRFRSRGKEVSVWQVPFEHDPATFGCVTLDPGR
jgi:hypothetical protein